MAIDVTIGFVIHMLFAAIWTGAVIFMTYGVIPVARAGNIDTDPFADITSRLLTLSRLSALIMFLTGGHLAAQLYTVETLLEPPRGHLVLTMLALWLIMAGLVEVGTKKISAGLRERKVRTPAEKSRPFFLGATVVALALLLVAGLLIGLPYA
ncbi:CopD family protein [Halorientalis brevis]|uniref:CopD family protein n=1 Tax=Halorientalis brevis TaxID=1126241 RepID=A0ABD6CE38_9EURY|nr:CopD family protein [Halorientalis brevis]